MKVGIILLSLILTIALGCLIFGSWLETSQGAMTILSIVRPVYIGCVIVSIILLGIGAYRDYFP